MLSGVGLEGSVMLYRATYAVEFAESLASTIQEGLASKVRRAVAAGDDEHKALADDVQTILREHLKKWGYEDDGLFDWEGNKGRVPGSQQHSYPLLGTSAHPDAAVLSPFTVAMEFDREPAEKQDWSHFKFCLMKAACHALSRAYDATLFVFTLRRKDSKAGTYLDDSESPHTKELLSSLRTRGLVIAIVPAG